MKWQRQSKRYICMLLPDNNIGDEGTKAIGQALKVNTSLTHIDLCENNIGDEVNQLLTDAWLLHRENTDGFWY